MSAFKKTAPKCAHCSRHPAILRCNDCAAACTQKEKSGLLCYICAHVLHLPQTKQWGAEAHDKGRHHPVSLYTNCAVCNEHQVETLTALCGDCLAPLCQECQTRRCQVCSNRPMSPLSPSAISKEVKTPKNNDIASSGRATTPSLATHPTGDNNKRNLIALIPSHLPMDQLVMAVHDNLVTNNPPSSAVTQPQQLHRNALQMGGTTGTTGTAEHKEEDGDGAGSQEDDDEISSSLASTSSPAASDVTVPVMVTTSTDVAVVAPAPPAGHFCSLSSQLSQPSGQPSQASQHFAEQWAPPVVPPTMNGYHHGFHMITCKCCGLDLAFLLPGMAACQPSLRPSFWPSGPVYADAPTWTQQQQQPLVPVTGQAASVTTQNTSMPVAPVSTAELHTSQPPVVPIVVPVKVPAVKEAGGTTSAAASVAIQASTSSTTSVTIGPSVTESKRVPTMTFEQEQKVSVSIATTRADGNKSEHTTTASNKTYAATVADATATTGVATGITAAVTLGNNTSRSGNHQDRSPPVCRYFSQGNCRYGTGCFFLHMCSNPNCLSKTHGEHNCPGLKSQAVPSNGVLADKQGDVKNVRVAQHTVIDDEVVDEFYERSANSTNCPQKIFCQKGLFECNMKHTKLEVFSFKMWGGGCGANKYKTALCTDPQCKKTKCVYAHGPADAFCFVCHQKGHLGSACTTLRKYHNYEPLE